MFEAIPACSRGDPNGRSGSHSDGRSHAVVFVWHEPHGIRVYDQWADHPVAQRVIRYRGGEGRRVNDGDQFYVVEAPELELAEAAWTASAGSATARGPLPGLRQDAARRQR